MTIKRIVLLSAVALFAYSNPSFALSNSETARIIKKAVRDYQKAQTLEDLYEQSKSHLNAEDQKSLEQEIQSYKKSPAPQIHQEGLSVVFKSAEGDRMQVSFAGLNQGKMNVNGTDIALDSLNAQERLKKIQEAMPKEHARVYFFGFFISEAQALGPLAIQLIPLAIDLFANVVSGSAHAAEISSALKDCQKIIGSDLYKAKTLNDAQSVQFAAMVGPVLKPYFAVCKDPTSDSCIVNLGLKQCGELVLKKVKALNETGGAKEKAPPKTADQPQ